MRDYKRKKILGFVLLLTATLWLFAGAVFSLDLNLTAEEGTVTMPDATVVTMWGLRDTANNPNVGAWSIPVFETTDTILNITLTNSLPNDSASTLAKPTSLIIPGLLATEPSAMVPTWTDGTTGSRGGDLTKRVRSLTREAANGGGTENYSWALKPGTYLIQSGSHQAVQVQMGLFAVLVVYPAATPNQAYDASATIPFDQLTFTTEQVLVYSEIDTALHAAIATDQYGTGKIYTSTMDYDPNYYLVNGQPFSAGQDPLNIGSNTDTVLLRFVNAGYETRIPVLQGEYFSLIADDGNLLPYTQELYSIELPAGKTKDVLLRNPQSPVMTLYDGRFNLTNAGVSGGGMLTKLSVRVPGLSVLFPNGGEALEALSTAYVSWAAPANAATFLVRLSLDGGTTWVRIAQNTPLTGFLWSVPDKPTTQGVIRVTAYDSNGVWLGVDSSDAFFTINAATPLAMTNPNGGEVLTPDLSEILTWTAPVNAASFLLRFSADGGTTWTLIARDVLTTEYLMTVPDTPTVEGVIRVTAYDSNGVWLGADSSDAFFTINAPTPLAMTNPVGGETLLSGSTENLTWTAPANAASFLLRLSTDGGTTWQRIARDVPTTEYLWTIPNLPTVQGVVRVTAYDSNGNWLEAASSSTVTPFTIQ